MLPHSVLRGQRRCMLFLFCSNNVVILIDCQVLCSHDRCCKLKNALVLVGYWLGMGADAFNAPPELLPTNVETFLLWNTLTYLASLNSCKVGNSLCRPSKHAVVVGYASVYCYATGTICFYSKAQFLSYANPSTFSFTLVKDATRISHGSKVRAYITAFLMYTSDDAKGCIALRPSACIIRYVVVVQLMRDL
jgi:hypothetical protein